MNGIKKKDIGPKMKFKKFTQQTTMLYKEKGTINISEVDKIVKTLENVAKKDGKNMKITRIYVVNGDKRATYKDATSFDDYYEGRVKDVDKFHEFFQVEITTSVSK